MMFRLAILVLALCGCHSSADSPPEPVTDATWPDGWVGQWRGMLEIVGGADVPPVTFTLTIGDADPDGSRPWQLAYGDQAPRDYRLVPVDPAEGDWAIDEQNEIVLPARLLDDTLVSAFAVGQQLLVTRQRFLPDRVDHEIIVLKREPEATGLGVATHGTRSRQRATLERVR